MKEFVKSKYVNLFLRLFLGAFLIYAAQEKIMHVADFAQAIRAYDIIPAGLSTLPAIFLPWIELFCGVLIIAGFYTRSSALIASSLLALFSLNVLIALFRGLDIDCGCGASIAGIDKVSWGKILENTLLIVLLLKLNFTERQFLAVDNIHLKP
ncbi:MAG: DoxX family membrane protein [Calditrichaeota bacterium]|nr:MAG: DoxX family membrane protein [Calditrichota bacterium]MBL1204278.1 DoxX family membrane protein [Calditrichota bacterium]NOG44108.1 DoxX family membrane protein [Calditrichota bacterium]